MELYSFCNLCTVLFDLWLTGSLVWLIGCEEGLASQQDYSRLEWTEIAKAVEDSWEPLPAIDTARINKFLLENKTVVDGVETAEPILIKDNP